jgi:hypothetical protein
MSWIEKNYEKVVLGVAVAATLGLAYVGWSKLAGVEEDFKTVLKGSGSNDTAVKGAELVSKALASRKLDRSWEQALDGDRPVDFFTGIQLFVASAAPDQPVDLLKDKPIHEPIPNIWWIKNRIDPGFADSPTRDPDEDGFSNLDEFKADTDPNDPASHPSLIAKLRYVKDETLSWVIIPRYGDGAGKFPFNYLDTKGGTNKTGAADMIEPGGTFFATGVMANRFKLLGSEVRKVLNKSINTETEVTIVRIADQRPNKKDKVYEFPAPMNDQRKNEYLQHDRTAVLSLEAIGYNGKEFKVEENTRFSLPPDGAKKDYLAKEVTPAAVTVEYTDAEGKTETVTINKGSMPESKE